MYVSMPKHFVEWLSLDLALEEDRPSVVATLFSNRIKGVLIGADSL